MPTTVPVQATSPPTGYPSMPTPTPEPATPQPAAEPTEEVRAQSVSALPAAKPVAANPRRSRSQCRLRQIHLRGGTAYRENLRRPRLLSRLHPVQRRWP